MRRWNEAERDFVSERAASVATSKQSPFRARQARATDRKPLYNPENSLPSHAT